MRNTNGVYKVGISKHVHKRRSEVEHMSGVPTELLRYYIFPDDIKAFDVEQCAHKILRDELDCGAQGEWFYVDDISVLVYAITQAVVKIKNDLEIRGKYARDDVDMYLSKYMTYNSDIYFNSDHYDMFMFMRYGIKISIPSIDKN